MDLSLYKDCSIIPLNIQEELISYLVADALGVEDKERFYILSQQFLLGIKSCPYKSVQN